VLKILAAIAFACTILLISDTSQARPKLRLLSSTPKPAAVLPPKPIAAAPVHQRNGGGLYVSVSGRPAAVVSPGSAQRAFDEPAKGSLQFDPTLASADATSSAALTNDEPPTRVKELTAAPTSECVTPKESASAKEKVAAKDEAGPIRGASLAPIANNSKQAAAPQAAVVCYVHRDESCKPL